MDQRDAADCTLQPTREKGPGSFLNRQNGETVFSFSVFFWREVGEVEEKVCGFSATLASVVYRFLWAWKASQRGMISALNCSGFRTATVLFPESHPPVSPGLMSRVAFSLFISGL